MFGFALWDRPRRRLFLARDRAGKKLLYYTHADGDFVFATRKKIGFNVPIDTWFRGDRRYTFGIPAGIEDLLDDKSVVPTL